MGGGVPEDIGVHGHAPVVGSEGCESEESRGGGFPALGELDEAFGVEVEDRGDFSEDIGGIVAGLLG